MQRVGVKFSLNPSLSVTLQGRDSGFAWQINWCSKTKQKCLHKKKRHHPLNCCFSPLTWPPWFHIIPASQISHFLWSAEQKRAGTGSANSGVCGQEKALCANVNFINPCPFLSNCFGSPSESLQFAQPSRSWLNVNDYWELRLVKSWTDNGCES